MTSTTKRIDELALSPFNVRTNAEDTQPNEAMEKSILAFGLIHALRVHPMRGAKGRWGVHAGGRRYRAIKALIARGDLPADWPIDVVIRDGSDADLHAESVAENTLRRELRPYEMFQGVAKSHRRGDSVDKIAGICGQEAITIRKWVRIGNLARPVFDALERGVITEDHARAFAATEDATLQVQAFEHFNTLGTWDKTPAKIRAYLRVGDVELSRLLRFVGSEAYVAAGGRLELDLFSDGAEERSRIMDEPILRQLAHDRFAEVRDATRLQTRRPDLRFVPEPPQASHGGRDHFLSVVPKVIDAAMIEIPNGDVVAFIEIGGGGGPVVTYWWASMKAKHGVKRDKAMPATPARSGAMAATGAAIGGMAAYGAKPLVNAEIKQESGLTAEGIEIFKSVRTYILRGALVENAEDAAPGGDVGMDYLVWAQLRILLKGDMPHLLGLRGFTGDERGPDAARAHIAAMPAGRIWALALSELHQQSFVSGGDLREAYFDYRASSPRLKRLAAAVVTGMALQRSLGADGYQISVHDAIAADLGLLTNDRLRTLWRPTEAMLDLVANKGDRLAIAEPFVERASFAPWSRAKSSDVTRFVLEVVTGIANTVRASLADAAARWVHPLLRFAGPDDEEEPQRENEPVNDAAGEQLEAAE